MKYTNEGLPAYIEVDTQHQGVILPSKGATLDDVYGSYSVAKAAAYERCWRICGELDGRWLCITSASVHFFGAQFEFDNPLNGRPMVCHITASRTYAMYVDMHHISEARKAWEDYAKLCRQMGVVNQWVSCDGNAHVLWVGGQTYIECYGELYRVSNPLTKNGKVRMRVVLQRVGSVDNEAVYMLHQDGHAFCGANAVCHVSANIGERYAEVCVGYVDDALDGYDGREEWECNIVCLTECAMMVVAACVDACSLMHGYDGHGMPVRLWA